MREIPERLQTHLDTGATTISRCWKVKRKDGVVMGFSDHDNELRFDNTVFEAGSGLDATALQTANGLSVDNTEASGALSSDGISEVDISAGKFDGAEVTIWLVNWQNVEDRFMVFNGMIGEITYNKNTFTAELRSFTDQLNNNIGKTYLKQCSATLGDGKCKFDVSAATMRFERTVRRVEERTILYLDDVPNAETGWFTYGSLEFISGRNTGAVVNIMSDKSVNSERRIQIIEELHIPIEPEDQVRLTTGCDKRSSTCASKFQNIKNFRGFPFIPGEDWSMAVPSSANSTSVE